MVASRSSSRAVTSPMSRKVGGVEGGGGGGGGGGGRSPNVGRRREEEMSLLFGEDGVDEDEPGGVEEEEYHGPFRGLEGPRKYWVAMLFWLLGGWAGMHRLYLGDTIGARNMCVTIGYCLVGWFRDGWRLQRMVDDVNEGRDSSGGGGGSGKATSTRRVSALSEMDASRFPGNRVSNTKYGSTNLEMALKFIPLSFVEQMERYTNRYFLFIAILQLDSYLTPANPLTTWIPLIIIMGFTAARELADDRLRFAADREANTRVYGVARKSRNGGSGLHFESVASERIRVGDIVLVRHDQEVPADLVLLSTSSNGPICYLETSNLDGESDLKVRVALSATDEDLGAGAEAKVPEKGQSAMAEVPLEAERELGGLITLEGGTVCRLSEQQALPQGSQLRNTDWATGLVVYSGNETRLGRSRRVPGAKRAQTDYAIDRLSAIVFVVQAAIALVLGTMGNAWSNELGIDAWYLGLSRAEDEGGIVADTYEMSVIPLRFLLLMSTMIPLSMQVTMDTCKWMYALWIMWDDGLTRSQQPSSGGVGQQDGAHVRNSDIAEDLGVVSLLLSDKTGTLTENVMVLKVVSVAGTMYGVDHLTEHAGDGCVTVATDASLIAAVRKRNPDVVQAMRVLALCNSVAVVDAKDGRDGGGGVHYEACSPDEEALVMSAAGVGVVLKERGLDTLVLNVLGSIERYTVLKELEFSSDRKRMSMILMDSTRGGIVMVTKGADESVLPLLATAGEARERETQAHIEELAKQGLRTLILAWREVPRKEYEAWERNVWGPANVSIDDRSARMAEAYCMIEKQLELLGGTGIEDKLQDGVPEAVSCLKGAGVRVWMATGDKLSTAKQVATSCGLIHAHSSATGPSSIVTVAVPSQIDTCLAHLDDMVASRRTGGPSSSGKQDELGVILTGSCLAAMSNAQKIRFVDAAYPADTVICCRLTPDQKAELVQLVKESSPGCRALSGLATHCSFKTLLRSVWDLSILGDERVVVSVGDGANDVAMIQTAHVGIGLVGREGSQAVRASDISVLKFKDLTRLMQYHGAYSYQRSSVIAQLSFFKSWAFCFAQVMYASHTGFAGTSIYDAFSISACNALLFIPLCFYSLNRHLPKSAALKRPELYRGGPLKEHMNPLTLFEWLSRAVFQAVVLFGSVLAVLGPAHRTPDGHPASYSQMAASTFCLFLIVQCCNVLLEMHTWTLVQVCVIVFGLSGAFALYAVCNSTVALGALVDYNALFILATDPSAVLLAPLVVVASMVPFVAARFWRQNYRATASEIANIASVMAGREASGGAQDV